MSKQLRYNTDTNVHSTNSGICLRCPASYPREHQHCPATIGVLHAEPRHDLDGGFHSIYLHEEYDACDYSAHVEIDACTNTTVSIEVWQINQHLWWAGRNLDEIKLALSLRPDASADQTLDPEFLQQLLPKELDRKTILDERAKPQVFVSWTEYLKTLILHGEAFPRIFHQDLLEPALSGHIESTQT